MAVRATPHSSPPTPTAAVPSPAQFVSPPLNDELDLDVNHDDAPLRFRTIDAVIGTSPPPGLVPRVLDNELHFTSVEEPSTFAIVEREPCWLAAMIEEMKSITDNSTWELVKLPPEHRAIGLKWVYKVKRDEQGNIVRHKARLVAKGYVQRAEINYDEVFTPVACMESV